MTTKVTLEPRVSILEEGQRALQRDLTLLSSAVREQGSNLSSAIAKLADTQLEHSNRVISTQNADKLEILSKISSIGKMDWTLILGFITVIVLLVGAISTPIWMNFSNIEKNTARIEKFVENNRELIVTGIQDRADLKARVSINTGIIHDIQSELVARTVSRWTKEDQHNFEEMISRRIDKIEQKLDK